MMDKNRQRPAEQKKNDTAKKVRTPDRQKGERAGTSPTTSTKRLERLKRMVVLSEPDGDTGEFSLKAQHTFMAPLLCAVVYLLVLITRTVDFGGVESTATETYLSLVAVQLFVFMLPCVFYIRFRSLDMRSDVRLRLPSPDKIMFCVLCALSLIVLSVFVSALGGVFGSSYEPQSIFETAGGGSGGLLYYAVCFAVIPAVCEELLFRGIIMSEYQRSSIVTAVVLNSMFFAMLHFDLTGLPFYFAAGLVLSMCAYAANSILASVCVHLAFNLFMLFGGEVVSNVVGSIGELTLIIIALFTLLLLLLTLTFGECQRIYASKAKRNKDSSYVPEYKKGTGAFRFFCAALSPMSLVCIVIFATAVLLL